MEEEIQYQRQTPDAPELTFSVKIHPETRVLVAIGAKELKMDQVETLAQAMRSSATSHPEAGDDAMKARAFSPPLRVPTARSSSTGTGRCPDSS